MNIFLISDTHFSHGNLLGMLSNGKPVRSFPSAAAMDEHMVERWNATVRPGDHVYHLGDVTLRRTGLGHVPRLNGEKRLILGNHDHFAMADYLDAGFTRVLGSWVLDGWLLTHYPVHESSLWKHRGNVHGHIHDKLPPAGPYVNVSVEAVQYTPVALEQLAAVRDVQQVRVALWP